MALINPQTSARAGPVQPGFKTSIIALFVAIVLVIGLALATWASRAYRRSRPKRGNPDAELIYVR
jgi:hypothetical protein